MITFVITEILNGSRIRVRIDLTNEEILDIINISIENNDYSSFVEGLVDESEFKYR